MNIAPSLVKQFEKKDMKENDVPEKQSMEEIAAGYKPSPYDVEAVLLPDSLIALTESIAENTHDCWAKARMAQGWTYGPERDDVHKKHPDLLPYSVLADEEKEYDRISAMNAIKLIVALGYTIQKTSSPQ